MQNFTYKKIYIVLIATFYVILQIVLLPFTDAIASGIDTTGIDENQEYTAQNPAEMRNVELINHIPSIALGTLAVQNDYAFVLMGSELAAFDISDPSEPILLDTLFIHGDVTTNYLPSLALKLNSDYAFLTTPNSVVIIQIAVPTNMKLITSVSFGYIRDIEVTDTHLFVAQEMSVAIFDISDISSPRRIGSYNAPWYTTGVEIQNNRMYVTSSSFDVVDISEPALPALTARIEDVHSSGLKISGTKAYLSIGLSYQGIQIIDISVLDKPVKLGYYSSYYLFVNFDVHQNMIYTTGDRLRIIDASDPLSPQEIASDDISYLSYLPGIIVSENFAYLSGGKLVILDISKPGNITQVGEYTTATYEANDVIIKNDYAYIAETSGFAVFDMSNKLSPTLSDWKTVGSGDSNEMGNLYSIDILGKNIYGVGGSYLYQIDISNPHQLKSSSIYTVAVGTPIYQVVTGEKYVYLPQIADGNDNKWLALDTSANSLASVIGSINISYTNNLKAIDSYIYASQGSDLHIFGIAGDGIVTELGKYSNDPFTLSQLAVTSEYVYATNGGGNLIIIDISDPTNPVKVSEYQLPSSWINSSACGGEIVDIKLEGNYIYTLDNGRGLFVIDISTPNIPTEAGRYLLPCRGRKLDIENKFVYIASPSSGLYTLEFAPPNEKTIIDSSGGSLFSRRDNVFYQFPANVFANPTVITHTIRYIEDLPTPQENTLQLLSGFTLSAINQSSGTSIGNSTNYHIQIGLDLLNLSGVSTETLNLFWWNGSNWIPEATTVVDITQNSLTASPIHLGMWSVQGRTHKTYLPLINSTSIGNDGE